MFAIRKSTYDNSENVSKAISKLTWAVEKVENFTWHLINNYTNDTNKQWIGTVNEATKKFKLIEPRGLFTTRHLFHMVFFQIIVEGEILEIEGKSRIKIEFRLGWYSFLMLAMLYSSSFFFIVIMVYNNSWGGIMDLTTWLLTFPVLGTLFLIIQLNKIENKIIDLFGL